MAVVFASVFISSLSASILQLCAVEIIVGAWFTAPYKIAEFLLHGPAKHLAHSVVARLTGRP